MAAYISSCPSCRHALEVTELTCPHCRIQIRGRFQGHPGLNLSDDQLVFLTLFVQSRGNLREIERLLGISYPTVRSKLDDLVEVFAKGETSSDPPPLNTPARERRDILEDVAQGRVTLQEGLTQLNHVAHANEPPRRQPDND